MERAIGQHAAVELPGFAVLDGACGVGGDAVEGSAVWRSDFNEIALAVFERVFAGNMDLPFAVFKARERVRCAVPAVKIAEEVNRGGGRRVLAEHPAALLAVQAEIEMTVGEGSDLLIAQKGFADGAVVLDAGLDSLGIGSERGINADHARTVNLFPLHLTQPALNVVSHTARLKV